MDRIRLINYLAAQRNAKSYLEICAHDKQNTFAHIQCSYKKSNYPASSDLFFITNRDKFDIIFIDGFHSEEQVLKDIHHSFQCLADGGIIILHDCMPPDAWHQRDAEKYVSGENWNGTVWKAALRTFNNSGYKCTLLDTDWGCGIIDTAQAQLPRQRVLPLNLQYELHYPWLLKYKQSVAEYLRAQVKVFYHVACMGNWKEVFDEQVQQLKQNGFYKIDLTVLGTENDLTALQDICARYKVKTNIIFHAEDLTYFEKPAILAIEEYARKNEHGYILYLHSKGVSNPEDGTKVKWRRLMMKELVQNWEYCMLQLPNYDAIGVNWREMYPTSHFCGNFWYASVKYLRKLADFNYYYEHPLYQIWDAFQSKRLGCEFWISSGREKPRVLSLFCRNVDFCNHEYWRNK